MVRVMSRKQTASRNDVRTYRKRAGLTQRDIAFLLSGRHVSAVHRWEQGRQLPSLAALLALEVVLDAHAHELFDDLAADVRRIIKQRGERLLKRCRHGARHTALRAVCRRCRARR